MAADEIQPHTKLLIANLDERAMPGSHWVCRYDGAWHDPLGSNGTDLGGGVARVGSLRSPHIFLHSHTIYIKSGNYF